MSSDIRPHPRSWPEIYTRLLGRGHLSQADASWAMDQIMSGEATQAQVGGFLLALRAKGETVQEMRGLADAMLAHALRFTAPRPSLDVVGTGGDRAHTVNISTTAAIVCAAAGVTVVKHGNRAASSSSGAADVLEALGLDLGLPAERVAEVVDEAGITFCFARAFHPAMRHAAGVRSELGVGTVFNFLGPLTNPAQPTHAAVGCADARMAPILAGVFADRGTSAAVVRGDDGLDELTLATTSTVWWAAGGTVVEGQLDPTRLGLAPAPTEALRGGDAAHNAEVIRRLFAGETGPVRDAVVLNAGLALAVSADSLDPADGSDAGAFGDEALHTAVAAGMARAARAIDEGAATATLDRWIAATRR